MEIQDCRASSSSVVCRCRRLRIVSAECSARRVLFLSTTRVFQTAEALPVQALPNNSAKILDAYQPLRITYHEALSAFPMEFFWFYFKRAGRGGRRRDASGTRRQMHSKPRALAGLAAETCTFTYCTTPWCMRARKQGVEYIFFKGVLVLKIDIAPICRQL